MQTENFLLIGLAIAFSVMVGGAFTGYISHLKRVAPVPDTADMEIYGQAADKRFKKLDVRSNGLFLLLAVGLGLPIFFILQLVERLRMALLPPAAVNIPMSGAFFGVVAIFSGMGLATAAFAWVARCCWSEDAHWYATYLSKRRYGCDFERLCRGVGIALIGLATLLLPLGLNCYVQARGSELAVHPFFGLHEQDHGYADIRAIVRVPRPTRYGQVHDYVVQFADGTAWSTADLPSGGAWDGARIARLLSEKSGLAIRREEPAY